MGFMERATIFKIWLVLTIALSFSPLQQLANAKTITIPSNTISENWSWTESTPFVFSSAAIPNMNQPWCPTPLRLEKIDGESTEKSVCITSDSGIRFGKYYANSLKYLISFPFDSKMYKITGLSSMTDDFTYLGASDILVSKQNIINGIVKSLVIYKNFSKKLQKYYDYASQSNTYFFDISNPDYVFRNQEGYAWPIGGVGASDNGEWLAVEFRQRGIGLLEIDTLKMKRISTLSYYYNAGFDPTSQLAVSNDGRHVAIMGANAGFHIFGVTADCGDEATDMNMEAVSPIENTCKEANVETWRFIDRLWAAFSPRFNDDGGELDFYASSYSNQTLEISLRAGGYSNKKMDYLALGDSFTSGEGETKDEYYLNGTNEEYEKCHVSINSYPFVVSDLMGIDVSNMANVACSGAVTSDVIGKDTEYFGQGTRLGKKFLNLNDSEATVAKTDARYSFLPGRIHQETFIREYAPKAVTVSIGGNDAGFMNILTACLSHETCSWANTEKGKEQAALAIKGLFPVLVNTYRKIHDDSPNSRIFVIGYPKIIDENNKCNLINGYMLDTTERRFINEGIHYLNSVIAAAAKYTGVKFIDIESSFGDQTLCGSQKPPAMNAIRFGDDITITNKFPRFKPIGAESFHPNPLGHTLTANMIYNIVDDFTTYNYCPGDSVVCPDGTAKAPEPSEYWIPDKPHDYPTIAQAEFVSDNNDTINLGEKHIELAEKSLQPGSAVKVEIASTPTLLGEYISSTDGSLSIDIRLPSDLEYGYHTVYLSGTSYSGEPIELYEVIQFAKKVKPNQINRTKPKNNDENKSASNHQLAFVNTEYASSETKGQVKGVSSISGPSRAEQQENRQIKSLYIIAFFILITLIPVVIMGIV